MHSSEISEYNRDQLLSFQAIRGSCLLLADDELEQLIESFQPYLAFRKALQEFQSRYFQSFCAETCFRTGLSACCGFESIITFFADQVITYCVSPPEEQTAILRVLGRPNRSQRCVYLDAQGCIWKVPPISCAMFLCEQTKESVFAEHSESRTEWERFQAHEKEFTHPTQRILFDDVERFFLDREVRSPHMYYHFSPGLLRLKAKAGILDAT